MHRNAADEQAGGDPSALLEQLDASIRRHPRVSGSGTTQAVRPVYPIQHWIVASIPTRSTCCSVCFESSHKRSIGLPA